MWNSILVVFQILAFADVEIAKTYTVEELAEKTDIIMLLANRPVQCSSESEQSSCEQVVVYEKSVEKIHVMKVDNRQKVEGNLDVNEILREPSSYSGTITSYALSTEFSGAASFDSVLARFFKDMDDGGTLKLKIITRYAGAEHEVVKTP